MNPIEEYDLRAIDEEIQQRKYELSRLSFYEFLKAGWRNFDAAEYTDNWHIEAICEHVEAVARGQIRHLLINIPPRCAKSSMLSVALAPWLWIQDPDSDCPHFGPQTSLMYASYAHTLSLRDSIKSRRLITSPWYQQGYKDRFQLTGDQNTKGRFDNDRGGYRIATSVGGALTGEGAGVIIIDDPHNAQEADSDLIRQGVLDWWDEAMSTRLNDPRTGSYIVVMQRLHESDLSGHIISKDNGDWTHLMLPMRHDPNRHCVTSLVYEDDEGSEYNWEDPRTEQGELLWPERYDEGTVKRLETALGPYGSASQLDQSPSPRGGGIIKEEWWNAYDHEYAMKIHAMASNEARLSYPSGDFTIVSVDPAFGLKQTNDYSGCTVWRTFKDDIGQTKILLVYAWKARLALHGVPILKNDTPEQIKDKQGLVERIADTAKRFGASAILVEAKASGQDIIHEMARLYHNEPWNIVPITPKTDKVARTHAIVPIFTRGMVYAPGLTKDGYFNFMTWAQEVIDETKKFPNATHDDLHDTMTQALQYLRAIGSATRPEEQAAIDAEQLAPQGDMNDNIYGV